MMLLNMTLIQRKLYIWGHRGRYTSMSRYDLMFFVNDVYTFHDIDQVKENGKKVIQNMEKRSLDMVLKRLVNEHFE